jgi:transcriptional regulator with XRE-family HTH domain
VDIQKCPIQDNNKVTTSNQLRAARALVGLSQDEVASKIGSSTKTVRRAEAGEDSVSPKTFQAIRQALEDAGVKFIEENGGGAGVRLAK